MILLNRGRLFNSVTLSLGTRGVKALIGESLIPSSRKDTTFSIRAMFLVICYIRNGKLTTLRN
jgi:hypothetical protein